MQLYCITLKRDAVIRGTLPRFLILTETIIAFAVKPKEVNFTCFLSGFFCIYFFEEGVGLGEWKQYYEVGYTGLMINGEGEGR